MDASLIERIARLRGIGDAYHDYRGELRHFSLEIKTGILRAMGCAVDDPQALSEELKQLEIEQWRELLPSVIAAAGSCIGADLNILARDFGASLKWTVILESGERREGIISTADCPEVWRGQVEGSWITRRRLELLLDLPPGYHELTVTVGAVASGRSRVIISPPACYEPSVILAGRRLWGVAVQLYTVRSRENWGIGDFSDLNALIRWLAPRGAAFIGLNPLHALAPADPERSSPYNASNRHFLNLLYISVPAVAEFSDCAAVHARLADPQFAARLSELREVSHVDYRGVAEVKFEILGLLYREFCERRQKCDSERAAAFRAFVGEGGVPLARHALFDALDRHFRATLGTDSGWLSWPAEFRDPDGPAAREFATRYAGRVEFFQYLQWLAHEQLKCAQHLARELGMPIGLYGDYAVGAHPSGSETWMDHASYRMGAEIGAPPDALALKGQGWGIPPPDPVAMQRNRLQGFVGLIRDNMRYFGALRLDHVMSLFRLWWVAAGDSPTQGAYVHYPLHQLLTALTLESSRSACMVVGEDLGVVPDEMRRAMHEFGLYHYKVLLFEKQDGRFRQPGEYPSRALATISTHDLPSLRAYWEGGDIDLRRELKLYPTAKIDREVGEERQCDRAALLAALQVAGLAPASPATVEAAFTPDLAYALHLYLARSRTALVALQIEDLLGMVDPVNVPGTAHEYPNWQRKLTLDVEEMAGRADFDASFAAIGRARE